ncbi:MAG: alkaline phosphatase D family protein [Cellvibrionaceae bacterium]
MVDITRRSALGLVGGAMGLAGCQVLTDSDTPRRYSGQAAFNHGVASGDPQSDRVILWTRVSIDNEGPVVDVSWQVFEDEKLSKKVRAGVVRTSEEQDYTIKVDVDGLNPATEYFYNFTIQTASAKMASPVGRTKTLAVGGEAPVRVAVVSCTNYPFGFFNVYDAISKRDELDAVIHLGDYLYEYGIDAYGGKVGSELGRNHDPATEIITLKDYRRRHAQYKSEKSLQNAHACAPWICTWDDHESANNAYRTGAENHDPTTEGTWTTRKQVAVQAYLEWMPVRDPVAGSTRSALWRSFDFGDVASIVCLETRLTGRSQEISWETEMHNVAPEDVPNKVRGVMTRVNDSERTMLGHAQEAWLSQELTESVKANKAWQVLANQTIMARVNPPDFTKQLSADDKEAITDPRVIPFIEFSALGLPLNLDGWDGFPAARERLYSSAKQAGAQLITLTGDTHTAWANRLVDKTGEPRGVEFGCTSVTSPGFGHYIPGVDNLGELFSDANEDVVWHDPHGNGFTLIELTSGDVKAAFFKVSAINEPEYTLAQVAEFRTQRDSGGVLEDI